MDPMNPALLVRHVVEALNARDAERVAGFYAADYKGLDVSRALRKQGRAGVCEELGEWWRAFPDLRFTTEDVVMQAGRVVLGWTAVGRHQGCFMHIPPTNRCIEVCGFSVLDVRAGEIVRALHLWDMAGLLRSMKLLPDLPGPPASSPATLLAAFFADASLQPLCLD